MAEREMGLGEYLKAMKPAEVTKLLTDNARLRKEREALKTTIAVLSKDNMWMAKQVTELQKRCTELLEEVRSMKRIGLR